MLSRLLLTTAFSLTLSTLAAGTLLLSGPILNGVAFAQDTGPQDTGARNAGSAAPESNTPSVATPAQTAAANATVALSDGVNVTEQDRARIGESIDRMNVKSLRGVDFAVTTGANVPRELRVHRLPADVVQIVPQYRDHRFLVVEKAIVIVEPQTNKIVAVLKPDSVPAATAQRAKPADAAPVASAPAVPATTTAAQAPAPVAAAPTVAESKPAPEPAAEAERPKAKKQASRATRRAASRTARDDWRRSSAEVRVGQRVPDGVVLYRVPPRYYYEVPETRGYRYHGYAGRWRGRTIYREFD